LDCRSWLYRGYPNYRANSPPCNPYEKQAIEFWGNAVTYDAGLGASIKRLLIDSGLAHRSREFATACKDMNVQHKFTLGRIIHRPMERQGGFIQLVLPEWTMAGRTKTQPNEWMFWRAGNTTATGTILIVALAAYFPNEQAQIC
jgi:hypothetical protein